jgi:hypothetical protein
MLGRLTLGLSTASDDEDQIGHDRSIVESTNALSTIDETLGPERGRWISSSACGKG